VVCIIKKEKFLKEDGGGKGGKHRVKGFGGVRKISPKNTMKVGREGVQRGLRRNQFGVCSGVVKRTVIKKKVQGGF